ncbi:SPASM domain-containing protein [Candidatus Saccharibacteria bacterium]|nr:SPASM domain-containing protein [Candidatus Saccharibacteria bacterium]
MYKNIAEFDPEHARYLEELTQNGLIPKDIKQQEVLGFLVEQLFVVEDYVNELASFQLGYNRSLFGSGVLHHTILTNLSCNLDCPYCFEDKTGDFMSIETADAYIEWLKPQLRNASKLYVTWYGGEPLLNKRVIHCITKKILPLQTEYGFEYSAGIVTNGVLLTKTFTDLASQLHICGVQITLDGDHDDHNRYRCLRKDHAGTFDTILDNLAYFCQNVYSDTANILRVNITDQNYDGIPDLLGRIPQVVKEKSMLLLRWIYSSKNGRTPNTEFSAEKRGKSPYTNLAPLYELADSLGFVTNSMDEGRTYNFCECDFDGEFLIDQDGDLFMCTHCMDKSESVGNVRGGFSTQRDALRYANFISQNPFDDRECLACKLLPLCKGGCRKARFLGKKACTDAKSDTKSYVLQKYYKALEGVVV